ncbi:MAG: RNA-binding domain-containing protein, partial [Nanoarchaeota archaeon]
MNNKMDKKEFDFLLSKGEDYKTEFKENLSGIDKDIVAFANTDGGIILVGVTDTGKGKGFTLSNKHKAEIQAVARNCDPAIHIEIFEEENVAIIVVPESTTKPHKCSTGFYLRNGATSQKLTVDEIRELFNKHGQLFYEEMINTNFTLHDFDRAKFDAFLKRANISKTLHEQELLKNLGLMTETGYFKNAAILLFGNNIERFIPQSMITCVLYKG